MNTENLSTENTSWHAESTPDYPPPDKKPERRLSLKAAMALATGAPGHETLMPLVRKGDKDLANNDDSKRKVETYLLNLQADIINREELLEQREKRFGAREKDLSKRASALNKKAQEIESRLNEAKSLTTPEKKEPVAEPVKDVTKKPETDLFEETRVMMREREAYIEQCENALVEKLTQLTKREAEIEVREEQLDFKTKQF
ncbi:MAG: hypothetical protein ACJAT5_000291 [Lentimonas sp.]|jgi:hypothetical protein